VSQDLQDIIDARDLVAKMVSELRDDLEGRGAEENDFLRQQGASIESALNAHGCVVLADSIQGLLPKVWIAGVEGNTCELNLSNSCLTLGCLGWRGDGCRKVRRANSGTVQGGEAAAGGRDDG